jgi:hypothetical protein
MGAYAPVRCLVIPALPTIQSDLHTTATGALWILTTYLLSAAVFTPIRGRLGDMWGKRRFLLVSLVSLAGGDRLDCLPGTARVAAVESGHRARNAHQIDCIVIDYLCAEIQSEGPGRRGTTWQQQTGANCPQERGSEVGEPALSPTQTGL